LIPNKNNYVKCQTVEKMIQNDGAYMGKRGQRQDRSYIDFAHRLGFGLSAVLVSLKGIRWMEK